MSIFSNLFSTKKSVASEECGHEEDSFETISAKVRNHIRKYGYIDTSTAIRSYFATRLSAIIFNAKKENGGTMNIGTLYMKTKKTDPRTGRVWASRYAVYYDADEYSEAEIRDICNV